MKARAKEYAAKGLYVFPLHTPVDRNECSCGRKNCKSPGKHPRWNARDLPNGLKNATRSQETIDTWWDRWPDANIGILTGKKSGIFVLDVDGQEGEDNIRRILGEEDLHTLRVRTSDHRQHIYFRVGEHALPNDQQLLPGVDTRGEGGYVVGPGSKHPTGVTYTVTEMAKIRPLPSKILSLILNRSRKITEEDWRVELAQGQRDGELTKRVGSLLGRGVPGAEVLDFALIWNQQHVNPPLTNLEVEKIVRSMVTREEDKRREKEAARAEAERPAEVVELQALTHAEARRMYASHEARWSVKDWLPSSTCGFAVAPPGSYKTWLYMELAQAITKGDDFLGTFPTYERGPVLMVQQEEFLPIMMERIGSVDNVRSALYGTESCDSDEHAIYWHTERQINFADKAIMYSLEKLVERIRPRMILMDPLYSMADMKDFGTLASQQMMFLKTVRDRWGCGMMIAHHTKKRSAGERERDDIWGSQFFNAWIETGWQIRLADQENTISIKRHVKNMPGIPSIRVQFDIDGNGFTTDAGDDDSLEEEENSQLMGMLGEEEVARGAINRTIEELE